MGSYNETDAETDAELDTGTEVEIGRPEEVDPTVNLETDADVGLDTDTELMEDGIGGEYYADEDSATAGPDLEADTEMNSEWDTESNADVEADVEIETDTEVETTQDGVGGPYLENRDQAINELGNLEGDANGEVSAEIEALDTDGLNDYVLNQIERAGPDAVEDLDMVNEEDTGY